MSPELSSLCGAQCWVPARPRPSRDLRHEAAPAEPAHPCGVTHTRCGSPLPAHGCSPAPAEQVTQFSLKAKAFPPCSRAVTKAWPASSAACSVHMLRNLVSSRKYCCRSTSQAAKGPEGRLPSSLTSWPHEYQCKNPDHLNHSLAETGPMQTACTVPG